MGKMTGLLGWTAREKTGGQWKKTAVYHDENWQEPVAPDKLQNYTAVHDPKETYIMTTYWQTSSTNVTSFDLIQKWRKVDFHNFYFFLLTSSQIVQMPNSQSSQSKCCYAFYEMIILWGMK